LLGDFPQNAWHVRGFPCKDVSVHVEEVDEHAFLFGRERGADVHHLALELLGSMRTSLVPSMDSKDPAVDGHLLLL
jgi:hypothetical protein